MEQFRRWFFKFLFGFDLVNYIFAQKKLLETTASAVATLMTDDNSHELISATTDTILAHQDAISEIQKALGFIIKTLESHQVSIAKLVDNQTVLKDSDFLN